MWGIDDVPPAPLAEQPTIEGYVGTYDLPFVRYEVTADRLVVSHADEAGPGQWFPPVDPPLGFAFCGSDHCVVTGPTTMVGVTFDFGRDLPGGPVAWLRAGSRAGLRAG